MQSTEARLQQARQRFGSSQEREQDKRARIERPSMLWRGQEGRRPTCHLERQLIEASRFAQRAKVKQEERRLTPKPDEW